VHAFRILGEQLPRARVGIDHVQAVVETRDDLVAFGEH
jgi:hypothetical protein